MKALRALVIIAPAVALAGCWLMKPDQTPRQEFAEALMHGNSMRASQVWLQMSPEDRLKFSRGESLASDPNAKDEVKREILNRYQARLQGVPAGSGDVKARIPTPPGASLRGFPALSGGASAPTAPPAPSD